MDFERIKLPLVRRIYPQLIADKIVSVQPLSGPSGLVHYLRYRYNGHEDQPVLQPLPKYRSIDEPWMTSSEGWEFKDGEWKERQEDRIKIPLVRRIYPQ